MSDRLGGSSHAEERRAIDVFGRHGNEILRRHDPLGLIADGAPDDEYDCVVTGAMIELMHERELSLAVWITEHFEDHFGTEPDGERVTAAARDLITLWRSEDLAALSS